MSMVAEVVDIIDLLTQPLIRSSNFRNSSGMPCSHDSKHIVNCSTF